MDTDLKEKAKKALIKNAADEEKMMSDKDAQEEVDKRTPKELQELVDAWLNSSSKLG